MQKIVIKVGTSSLLGKKEQPSAVFEKIASEIKILQSSYNIVLVTSGAIGFGVRELDLDSRPNDAKALQALSCVGQTSLMNYWHKAFNPLRVGQILVTGRELVDAVEEERLKSALSSLWGIGAIPIANENDALTDAQTIVGDNDTLAAHLAVHIEASTLVLLSDVNGVYQDFNTDGQVILRKVTTKIAKEHVTSSGIGFGTGGLTTKIQAAEIAGEAGVKVFLIDAREENAISSAMRGDNGTEFVVQ